MFFVVIPLADWFDWLIAKCRQHGLATTPRSRGRDQASRRAAPSPEMVGLFLEDYQGGDWGMFAFVAETWVNDRFANSLMQAKPWCHTTAIPNFAEAVANNKVMEAYD
jgi:hypothetical protein